jgi:hypothetical protein
LRERTVLPFNQFPVKKRASGKKKFSEMKGAPEEEQDDLERWEGGLDVVGWKAWKVLVAAFERALLWLPNVHTHNFAFHGSIFAHPFCHPRAPHLRPRPAHPAPLPILPYLGPLPLGRGRPHHRRRRPQRDRTLHSASRAKPPVASTPAPAGKSSTSGWTSMRRSQPTMQTPPTHPASAGPGLLHRPAHSLPI